MKRLTESNPFKDFMTLKYTSKKPIFLDCDKGETKVVEELLNKLGQLEDIEDELGISLVIYHKLMEMLYCGEPNVLFVKDNDKIVQVGVLEIDYCKKKIIFYKDTSYNDDYIYGFCQYGKTWALTKEELL